MTMVGAGGASGTAICVGCTAATSGARRGAARPFNVNVTAIPNTKVVKQSATAAAEGLLLVGRNAATAADSQPARSRSEAKIFAVGTDEADIGIASWLLRAPSAISIRNDRRPMNTTLFCSPPSELITSAVSFYVALYL
jgi:hypothetical protein